MPAFLGAQSFIMMYQAGEGWQYGKRRISALSNEEFNKITPQSLMERQAMELKGAIPIMERSMDNMTRMIPQIIAQYGDFIREAIKAMPQLVQNVVGGQAGANLQSNISGFNDLLKIVARALPNLPQAEARLVTAEIVKQTPVQNIRTGTSVLQVQARQKQLVHEESLREKDKLSVALAKIPQPVPIGVKWTKQAGQSQIKERTFLIHSITNLINQVKNNVFPQQVIDDKAAAIRVLQQRLVNLLARYKF